MLTGASKLPIYWRSNYYATAFLGNLNHWQVELPALSISLIRDLALLDLHQYKSGAQVSLSNGVVWRVMEAMVICTSLEMLTARLYSESSL